MIFNYEKIGKRIGKVPWGYNEYQFQVRGEKKIYEATGTLTEVKPAIKKEIIRDLGLSFRECTVDVL